MVYGKSAVRLVPVCDQVPVSRNRSYPRESQTPVFRVGVECRRVQQVYGEVELVLFDPRTPGCVVEPMTLGDIRTERYNTQDLVPRVGMEYRALSVYRPSLRDDPVNTESQATGFRVNNRTDPFPLPPYSDPGVCVPSEWSSSS